MRKKPYSEIGIRRLKCFRSYCNNVPEQQWNICADDNVYRPICNACDIELNIMVLKFMGFKKWQAKIDKYKLRFL